MQRGAMPGRPMMASLRGATASLGTRSVAAAQPQEEQNEPVDESALRYLWNTYIQSNPSEKLLVTAMGNCQLELHDGTRVVLNLTGEEQKLRIAEHQEQILSFLKQQLRNTHLMFDYVVHQQEVIMRAFTPREKMDEIRKSRPQVIDALVDTFGLELY